MLTRTRNSWKGTPIVETNGTVDMLRDQLPVMTREPLRWGGVENKRLDLILGGDGYPVGTVSKDYELVQHTDVFDCAVAALEMAGFDSPAMTTKLQLAEHGEWMRTIFELPGYDFTPQDGHPMVLRISVVNSMDKTTAVGAQLEWLRLVCGNLMMAAMGYAGFRKAHIHGLVDAALLKSYMDTAIELVPQDQGKMIEWAGHPIEGSKEDWANGPLTELWGQKTAARAYTILQQGYDGAVSNVPDEDKEGMTATKRVVSLDTRVPGQTNYAYNAWDVANALSYLTQQSKSVSAQAYRLRQLPQLVENLAYGTPLHLDRHYDVSGNTVD